MIDILVSNGIPHVWDPADWYKLRTEHRILGCFDGALAENEPCRTHFQLPLKLSKCETQYLVKNGIARTVECPKLSNFDAPVTREKFQQFREDRLKQGMEDFKVQRRISIEALVDKIIEGKRAKGRSVVPDRNTVIQDELAKITKLPYEMIKIDLKDPWTTPEDYVPLEFPLPNSALEILRFRVFEDFHFRRKYYLTPGYKFGGDFLAYPGDPDRYHAEFVIICQENDRKRSPNLVISQERLTHSVKKTLLIASLDEDLGEIKYRCGRYRHQRLPMHNKKAKFHHDSSDVMEM